MKNNRSNILPSGIDLVAIDLDGTLLSSNKELPVRAAEVFRSARRAGLRISIVTGRNPCSANEVAKALDLSGPHASAGGAMVCGNGGRPVYARHTLSLKDTREIINICRRWNLTIFLLSSRLVLMENGNQFLRDQPVTLRRCTIEVCTDILANLRFRPLKATIYGPQPGLSNALAEIQACSDRFHVTTAGEEDIEITPTDVNKGSALRKISTITGIDLQNIMVIGDSPNDLSMFREAGLAVAVGNAFPEVKQAANLIVPSNDEGGVLWAIQNLALSPVAVREQFILS